jgi:hypothetical protein
VNGKGYSLLEPTDAVAFLWRPRTSIDNKELDLLWSRNFPVGLKTVYLLDMGDPLRLTFAQLSTLKLRAGPWYGYRIAFVDLDPNPVQMMDNYLAGRNLADVVEMPQEVNTLKAAISWERDLSVPRLPHIEVRILTPVFLKPR